MKKDYSNLHRVLVIKYFWQVMRNFKTSLFFIILGSVFYAGLDIYIPFQFLKLWNILNSNNFEFVSQAKGIIIIIFMLGFARWGVKRLVGFSNSYFQSSVMAGLRSQAFSYMIGHSHSFFTNNFGGSLTQKINKYARAFEKLMDKLVNDGLPLIIRSVGTIIAIYTLVPKYAIILAFFCVIFLLTALIYTRFKLKYDVIASLADTTTTGVLADAISNHSSIQLFSGHDFEISRAGEVIQNQKKATVFNWYLWEGLGSIQSLYFVIMEFIIFWIAIGDWKLDIITLPIIVLIQSYLGRLTENLWSFAGIVRTFYDGFADAQEMVLVLNTPHEVGDNITNTLLNTKGEVVFEKITYIYTKNKTKIFDNFSLKIPAGQKIAIVGSSGAGKSTFVNLLMRLFNTNSGRILIDGIDITSISQKNLREQIAFVPQNPVLFHRTLMENIRYGKRDATDEEVKNAAHLAHCDKFINKLPYGYETYVGERGTKLSGGERQRVAIARAILANAPILVLDEATSALDSESEVLIQDALRNLIKNKTTIVIAHRLSTIREMDRIIIIEDGKIIEDDTHDVLLNKDNGIYKKLWNLQAGGFNKNSDLDSDLI
ncbi:MAG: ABC transporter ATP-binding protein [Candidatus Pacebacteria bacterium]|nr:ABC transporter ATP-binding protein [Candidatus Paceibacterota bacterium]